MIPIELANFDGGKAMTDKVCLAEGYVCSTDTSKTGINDNVIPVGSTGSGKTVSYCESRMLHTTQTSLIVPIAKKKVKEKYKELFKKRGYKVYDIDFAHPERANIGYDPLEYVKSEEDIMSLSKQIAYCGHKDNEKTDPYWPDSAACVIAAIIILFRLNEKTNGKKAGLADVIDFINSIQEKDTNLYETNMDVLFEEAEERYPGNSAYRLWKNLKGNSPKTAGCIMAFVYNAIASITSESVLKMLSQEEKINIRNIGKEKTIAFITTSPMNKSLQNLINIFYGDLFRELFEAAEDSEDGRLDIPVHIICDDFACSGKIVGFEDYISIFRAAGISVSLLLQSESQLSTMYGDHAATTIINNCDTYIFMGGSDLTTCKNVALRLNKPLNRVINMPLEQVIVFRRGSEPVVSRRYQTYSDPIYIENFNNGEKIAE